MISDFILITLQDKVRKLTDPWIFGQILLRGARMTGEAWGNALSLKERQLGDMAFFEDKLTSYANTHWLQPFTADNLLFSIYESFRFAKIPDENTMDSRELIERKSATSSPSDGLVLMSFGQLFQKMGN